ncbi:MAG: metallophosphatase family protein [Nitrososphaerales archaeon]|nr:metallophosphatase family protein [Nitrososphaerales archaeon]
MRIGVLSDTHKTSFIEIPSRVIDELRDVDIIIHAGDYTSMDVVDGLKGLGRFRGVHGNMDSPEVKSALPRIDTFEVRGFKIGVTHSVEGFIPFNPIDRSSKVFKGVDVMIYGHTHIAKSEVRGGVLYFNPGSATGKFPALYKSIGIITLDDRVNGRILKL